MIFREQDFSQEEFRSVALLIERRSDDNCGRTPDGKFGPKNDCQDGNGGPTAVAEKPKASKQKAAEAKEPLSWTPAKGVPDAFATVQSSPPVSRAADGTIKSETFDRSTISSFAGREYVSPVACGRHLAAMTAATRGRPIDSKKPLSDDEFEFMAASMTQQAQAAMDRGHTPAFYSPEERKKQIEQYATLHPVMRGGVTASGFKIGTGEPGESIHPSAEFLFRAVQALTSPQASPFPNMQRADQVLTNFFTNPDVDDAKLHKASVGGNVSSVTKGSLERLQAIIDKVGLEEAARIFSEPPMRAGDLEKFFRDRVGIEGFSAGGYSVDEVVPIFSIFGPKVGPFFANNTGDYDALTADVWFTRTWGRLTGELVSETKPDLAKSHAKDLKTLLKYSSEEDFRGLDRASLEADVANMAKTGDIPESVATWALQRSKRYSKEGFNKGVKGVRDKANARLSIAILKNLASTLDEPETTTRRSSMIKVMQEVSARIGQPVAYVQDLLWQDEQDVWGAAGARTATDIGEPSLFSTGIERLVRDPDSRPAVAENKKPSRKKGKTSKRSLVGESQEEFDGIGDIEQLLFEDELQDVTAEEFAEAFADFFSDRDEDAESRSADCGRTPDGKFGNDNKCQDDGGATTSSDPLRSGGKSEKSFDVKSDPPFPGAEKLASFTAAAGEQVADRLDGLAMNVGEAVKIVGADRDGNSVYVRPAVEFAGDGDNAVLIRARRDVAGVKDGIEATSVLMNVGPKDRPEIVLKHHLIDVTDAVKSDATRRHVAAREFFKSMADSVKAARAGGVSKVVLNAAGRAGGSTFKGYTIWPRMGFDAPLPFNLKQKLPEGLSHAKTLLDLHTTREGARWWRDNGTDIDVVLDLANHGSPQNQAFDAFVRKLLKESREMPLGSGDEWLSPEDLIKLDELWDELDEKGLFDEYDSDAADFSILDGGKKDESRSRDCGQDDAGRFNSGNKCASDGDYRGSHKAPKNDGYAVAADDLTGLYPDDVYSSDSARLYGHGDPSLDRESARIVQSLKGKPDETVRIYRAVPADADDVINPGDWVTINESYAKQHGESTLGGDYKVASMLAPARHIFNDGNGIHEWGYDPRPKKEGRAFCPTGEGGGIDNSCSSVASTKTPRENKPRDRKSHPDELRKVVALSKSNATRKEIQDAIEDAIVGKSGWFGGYTPGPVLPSELCKALGVPIDNLNDIDDLMASSWGHERVAIASLITQLSATNEINPRILKDARIRIDTMKTVSEQTGDSWSSFLGVAGAYVPSTDVIHYIAGSGDSDHDVNMRLYESKFTSTPEDAHVIVHEIAHRDHYREIEKRTGLRRPKNGSVEEQAQYFSETQEAVYDSLTDETLSDPAWKQRFLQKAGQISFYATTDPFELVAEYTTAVRLGHKENDPDLDRFCKAMYAPVPRRVKA